MTSGEEFIVNVPAGGDVRSADISVTINRPGEWSLTSLDYMFDKLRYRTEGVMRGQMDKRKLIKTIEDLTKAAQAEPKIQSLVLQEFQNALSDLASIPQVSKVAFRHLKALEEAIEHSCERALVSVGG